jgi:hypothetical protein
MKILIVRKDLKDTTSGVPKIVLHQLDYFTSQGHKTYVIAETLN